MEENVTLVFRGFLNLSNLEKLRLTGKINDYLDSMQREPLRAENERKFVEIVAQAKDKPCPCCGRSLS